MRKILLVVLTRVLNLVVLKKKNEITVPSGRSTSKVLNLDLLVLDVPLKFSSTLN